MKEKEYKKLPGRGTKRRAFLDVFRIRTRLWLGKDHLLYQLSTGYTENYKRFYYSDIQAITIRKTTRFMVWNIILLALLLGFLAASYRYEFLAYPSYTAAFFSFLFLGINLFMGQTCVCQLYTRVSTEELHSLQRLRTAQKAIKIITPLIDEKQRDISSAGISPSAVSPERKDKQ